MYQTNKLYVTTEMKVSDIIFENPSLLILMEHFEIPCVIHEKTVGELCTEFSISEKVFIVFANLYNGFKPTNIPQFSNQEIRLIIRFLGNSHAYYKNDKYPEIQSYINELTTLNNAPEIKLVETFFNEYFEEVIEHLDYENQIAYPFFATLLEDTSKQISSHFSAEEYHEHHTDIEYKLAELKNLLLKHISLQNDGTVRRKLLMSLFELEYDLKIHSIIEEMILVPLMRQIEKK